MCFHSIEALDQSQHRALREVGLVTGSRVGCDGLVQTYLGRFVARKVHKLSNEVSRNKLFFFLRGQFLVIKMMSYTYHDNTNNNRRCC